MNFNIPSNIPSYLYPIKCEITTQKLYPTEPNKNLEVEYVNGTYKYIYWATSSGAKILNFKTSFENSDETVTIENPYFKTASVDIKARHFTDLSVNGNNLVNYGSGSTATVNFTLSDVAGSPATYPLTVTIHTDNLQPAPGQTGWTQVTGGYSHTYTSAPSGVQSVQFVSNKDTSYETISISANGFSSSSLFFDNVLANSIPISGNVREIYNGNTYTLPNRAVVSNNTAVVNSFTTSRSSTYSISVKEGARFTDMVTFSSNGVYVSYTVEMLIQGGAIIFRV